MLLSNSDQSGVPIAVVTVNGNTKLLKIDRDYDETLRIVKHAFDVRPDATVTFYTDALPACKGRLIEIDASAYPFLLSHLDELQVVVADPPVSRPEEGSTSRKGKQRADTPPDWAIVPKSQDIREESPTRPTVKASSSSPVQDVFSASPPDFVLPPSPSPTPRSAAIAPAIPAAPLAEAPPPAPFAPTPAAEPVHVEKHKRVNSMPLIDANTPQASPSEVPKTGSKFFSKTKNLISSVSTHLKDRDLLPTNPSTQINHKAPEEPKTVTIIAPTAQHSKPIPIPRAEPIPLPGQPSPMSPGPILVTSHARPSGSGDGWNGLSALAHEAAQPDSNGGVTSPRLRRSETPPLDRSQSMDAALSPSTSQPDRFLVTIHGPLSGQIAQFKTRPAHTIKRVLSAACRQFEIDYEDACLFNNIEVPNEDGGMDKYDFECKGGETLAGCGITVDSRLFVRLRNSPDSGEELT